MAVDNVFRGTAEGRGGDSRGRLGDCFLYFLFTQERTVVRGAHEESLKKWKRAGHPSLLTQAVISGVEGELDKCVHACMHVWGWYWPKGSFGFFHNILQKNMNELYGQVPPPHTHTQEYILYIKTSSILRAHS